MGPETVRHSVQAYQKIQADSSPGSGKRKERVSQHLTEQYFGCVDWLACGDNNDETPTTTKIV